ncbi:MAG: cell division protein SepF [Bacteroides cellulosilyticus]
MLSEIMDRLNLWHYEDADDREERAGLFGNRMEENEGNFLLNIVTYKPRTMDDVQEICERFLDGDAVILSLEQAEGKNEERIVIFYQGRYQPKWKYLKDIRTYLCDIPRGCGDI